jgi:predicted dehydrogenase
VSQTKLRGAIVGYGNVAEAGHMSFWRASPEAEVVAIADSDPGRRRLFANSVPGGHGYEHITEMLTAERLDFVDICTSPSSHAGLIELALAAGLHVLCEKPLTIAAIDTVRIAKQAATAGRVVHTVHNWLAAPVNRKVSSLLDAQEIGQVRLIEWSTLRTGPAVTVKDGAKGNWRLDPQIAGGGILIDHGWHALYCVMKWAGTGARAIEARLENRRYFDLGVEDTATLKIDFGTVEGRIHLTWAAEDRANSVTVIGTRGRIDVEGAEVKLTRGTDVLIWTCPPSLAQGSHHPEWFADVENQFLALVGGTARGNILDAVQCSVLIDCAQHSSANGGRRVALPRQK